MMILNQRHTSESSRKLFQNRHIIRSYVQRFWFCESGVILGICISKAPWTYIRQAPYPGSENHHCGEHDRMKVPYFQRILNFCLMDRKKTQSKYSSYVPSLIPASYWVSTLTSFGMWAIWSTPSASSFPCCNTGVTPTSLHPVQEIGTEQVRTLSVW